MIKFLVNSKYLLEGLKQIDFTTNSVEWVYLEGTILRLVTSKGSIDRHIHILKCTKNKIEQNDRGWDDIADILSGCDEQPVVIEIYKNVVNLIFQV